MSQSELTTLLHLPVQERLRIAEALWDSVADEAVAVELHPWQAAELDRRMVEFEADPSEGIPWAEVRRQVTGRA